MINESNAIERWLPTITLLEIFGLTLVGLVLGLAGVGLDFEDDGMRLITYGVLVLVAIVQFVTSRYFVLPAKVNEPGVTRQTLAVLAYAFSSTGSIFAIAGALVTGSGWLALPLGGIALVAWVSFRAFLEELPHALGTETSLGG